MTVQRALFLVPLLTTACWGMPGLARHPTLSGTDLVTRCTTNEYACEAYISGVVDAWCAKEGWPNCSGPMAKDSAYTICLPDNVGTKQVKDIVVNWLNKFHGADALVAPLILYALSDAYPCPKTDW